MRTQYNSRDLPHMRQTLGTHGRRLPFVPRTAAFGASCIEKSMRVCTIGTVPKTVLNCLFFSLLGAWQFSFTKDSLLYQNSSFRNVLISLIRALSGLRREFNGTTRWPYVVVTTA